MTDTAASDETPEVTHQPTLPDLELPDYHGRIPVGMRTALTGAGNRLTKAHGIGDRVVLVIEAKVKRAGHEDTDDGLIYTETHKVADLFELDRDPGARLLAFLRSQYRQAKDAADGKAPIPDLADVGWTDASGVVLTPEELAERRGDPVALLGADVLTPAVIIYDDGSRFLWPDEYPKGWPRPSAGNRDSERGEVVELVHHATGETLERLPTVVEVSVETDTAHELAEADRISEVLEVVYGEQVTNEDLELAGTLDDVDELTDDYDDGPAYVEDADGFADVVPFERPTAKPDPPSLPGEDDLADRLPTVQDFAFVNVTVPKLAEKIAELDDPALLRRLIEAERQGRGRGLEARKGALDALHARLAAIGGPA